MYNGGVPCDLTASSVYTNSGSLLFDWIRFETVNDGIDNNFVAVNSSNPGSYNATANAVRGFKNMSFMPVCQEGVNNNSAGSTAFLAGCSAVFVGISESLSHTCSNNFDNLNQFHPIPRSDRQYSWFTGSMEFTDPCNYRYSGYMPLFGEQQGRFSGSNGYEPWMTLISASDFGSFNNSAFGGLAFGATKKWAEQNSDILKDWTPQDFVGLNTLVYEPITSSLNVLGYPPSAKLFDEDNENAGQYRNKVSTGYVGVFRGTVSGSGLGSGFKYWASTQAPGYIFNSLMLKRNGPYGYGTHAQFRRNPNHPILRNERSSSEISVITYAERDVYGGVFVLSPPHWDPYGRIIGQKKSAVTHKLYITSSINERSTSNIKLYT